MQQVKAQNVSGCRPGYEVEQSLLFGSNNSSYLSRTPSAAGNRKTWTWSGWFKMGIVEGSYRTILGSGGGTSRDRIQIFAGEQLVVNFGDGADANLKTTQVFRDPSAWYHLVVDVDTTQATSTDRIKIYVNGEQISAFDTENYPTQNYDTNINNTDTQYIGQSSANNYYWDGYLAEVHLIDGQALGPEHFAIIDSCGVYSPIPYTGTYGTNGFYLPFDPSGFIFDQSGNGNHFSSIGLTSDDLVADSPTNNYCTFNPLSNSSRNKWDTVSEGNLKLYGAGDNFGEATFLLNSGK